MSHIHISSDDVQVGNTSNGTFNLSGAISGQLTLVSHYIEPGDIPWIYPGGDQLLVRLVASPFTDATVNFGTVLSDDPVTVCAAIVSAFDAVSFLAGTTCVFVPGTDSYDVGISNATTLRWSESASTAKNVFNKKTASDEVNVTAFSLDARHVDSRPKYMAVYISESGTINSGSRVDPGDLVVSTFDEELRGAVIGLAAIHVVLSIEWRRINIPLLTCPFTLIWDLVFTG